MTTRGKIQYDVTADTAKFTSQMQKVNNRLGGMQSMLKGMVGTLAGVFAVGQVINFGKELFKIAETSVEVQNAFDRLNDSFPKFIT